MGYQELFGALRTEVRRRGEEIAAAAKARADALLAAAHADAESALRTALAGAREEIEMRKSRAIGAAKVESERASLGARHALLERARSLADARLRASEDEALARRLADEVASEIVNGVVELRVDPRFESAVFDRVTVTHPALSATVAPQTVPRGGVEAVTDGEILDNTLVARLDKAWRAFEPEIARMLFEGADDRV